MNKRAIVLADTPLRVPCVPRWRFGGKEIAGQKVGASVSQSGSVSVPAGTPAAAAGRPYLDFGAWLYDPRTAAWLSQDPLSEKYYPISPYAYCAGNPVNLVDPTGEESKPLFVQVAPVLYEVFKTIVIATAAYWGAKSVSQAIEKGDSEEYSYNPGWGWQEKRDHESRDETERIKLKHRESMNNSMGDPENHDDNNNFKNRGGPRSLGTALLLLAFSQTEPGQMILSFIRDWLHSDNSVDNENASPASVNNPVEPKDNNFAEYLERIKRKEYDEEN